MGTVLSLGYIPFGQDGSVEYASHLPVHVAMSSGEAEYIFAAAVCMRASHLRILIHDLRCMGRDKYDQGIVNMEPVKKL